MELIQVASFAEAWIEILTPSLYAFNIASPPSRRRGLKLEMLEQLNEMNNVASFAEAWIEILTLLQSALEGAGSPPSRRRGLKLKCTMNLTFQILSPPSRRRGLK